MVREVIRQLDVLQCSARGAVCYVGVVSRVHQVEDFRGVPLTRGFLDPGHVSISLGMTLKTVEQYPAFSSVRQRDMHRAYRRCWTCVQWN